MAQEPSAAQKSIGDIAPKLADLTDTRYSGTFGNVLDCRIETEVWLPSPPSSRCIATSNSASIFASPCGTG